MKIKYIEKNFAEKSLTLIGWANDIIDEYAAQGYDLTLRQLYYQMVARNLIENKFSEYKRVGSIINDARLAGLIDWNAIVDRTRVVRANSHWKNAEGIIVSSSHWYLENYWKDQDWKPEVWIEKDALVGVISEICREYNVPYFSCRGYSSQTAMHEAGHGRIDNTGRRSQRTLIIHLADHDPSGVHMTEDIDSRLNMFAVMAGFDVKRIALNMDQIEQYNPPPNYAKLTDTRSKKYIPKYGESAWELDALEPKVLVDLIRDTITNLIDWDSWNRTKERISEQKTELRKIAHNYDKIQDFLASL